MDHLISISLDSAALSYFPILEDNTAGPSLQDRPEEDLFVRERPANPLQEIPQPYEKRPKSKDLSRDDWVGLQKMKEWTGWTATEITRWVPFSAQQVQYALDNPPTPKKTNPRPGGHRLTEEELQRLDQFLRDNPQGRDIA
ncbi:hypothetical protein H9Q72_010018 [Fusarium xylarioides]|uniref:Uncharacterized protein n=1 Tax=Fusarium xylarioides TaxID=221167 RepID=A0A9P7L261_9HYPO|nr:hypothetical protein H9Q72_010018 [Fusarium xylarioides]